MNQDWLEMKPVRRRTMNTAVWIPLRANRIMERSGRAGFLGFREEYLGVGTVAIPINERASAREIDWMELGNSRSHCPRVEDSYFRSDAYKLDEQGAEGVHLVLHQRLNRLEIDEWHLNQDMVLGLSLKREGDLWLAANEGYVEVARLKRKDDGSPALLEIRAEHLKDYLCARKMALYMTSYRQRQLVVESRAFLLWKDDTIIEAVDGDRWEGRIQEIHEGGHASEERGQFFECSEPMLMWRKTCLHSDSQQMITLVVILGANNSREGGYFGSWVSSGGVSGLNLLITVRESRATIPQHQLPLLWMPKAGANQPGV